MRINPGRMAAEKAGERRGREGHDGNEWRLAIAPEKIAWGLVAVAMISAVLSCERDFQPSPRSCSSTDLDYSLDKELRTCTCQNLVRKTLEVVLKSDLQCYGSTLSYIILAISSTPLSSIIINA